MRRAILVVLCFSSMFLTSSCSLTVVEPVVVIDRAPDPGRMPQNPKGPQGQYHV